MKKILIINLELEARAYEDISSGDYWTPAYYSWWWEDEKITLNGCDVTELFKTAKEVIDTFSELSFETGKIYTNCELEIEVEVTDRIYYKECDITDFLTQAEKELLEEIY